VSHEKQVRQREGLVPWGGKWEGLKGKTKRSEMGLDQNKLLGCRPGTEKIDSGGNTRQEKKATGKVKTPVKERRKQSRGNHNAVGGRQKETKC